MSHNFWTFAVQKPKTVFSFYISCTNNRQTMSRFDKFQLSIGPLQIEKTSEILKIRLQSESVVKIYLTVEMVCSKILKTKVQLVRQIKVEVDVRFECFENGVWYFGKSVADPSVDTIAFC